MTACPNWELQSVRSLAPENSAVTPVINPTPNSQPTQERDPAVHVSSAAEHAASGTGEFNAYSLLSRGPLYIARTRRARLLTSRWDDVISRTSCPTTVRYLYVVLPTHSPQKRFYFVGSRINDTNSMFSETRTHRSVLRRFVSVKDRRGKGEAIQSWSLHQYCPLSFGCQHTAGQPQEMHVACIDRKTQYRRVLRRQHRAQNVLPSFVSLRNLSLTMIISTGESNSSKRFGR